MPTTMDQFWTLYTQRSGHDRYVTWEQLAHQPTVTALRAWPLTKLGATAPAEMRRCLPPLQGQLQAWLRDLKAANASDLGWGLPADGGNDWREQHSLAYWNTSGPNGGLRRWG